MTAALNAVGHEDADASKRDSYPSRMAIRLNEPTHRLYGALETAQRRDGITYSHRVLAMVSLWEDGHEDAPELRDQLRALVAERAAKIAQETKATASRTRAESIRQHYRKKNGQALQDEQEERAVS